MPVSPEPIVPDVSDDPESKVMEISPELEQAIKQFRQRMEQISKTERQSKTLQQVAQESGIKVGQIWRPRFDGIIMPGEARTFSVTESFNLPLISSLSVA